MALQFQGECFSTQERKMYASVNDMPTPIGTIDELLEDGDTSARPFKVFIGHNLGNRSFLMSIPLRDFFSISQVANERSTNGAPLAQRPLNEEHASKLAVYILKGLVSSAIKRRQITKQPDSAALSELQQYLGPQPYLALQPIVVNIRNCNPGGANIAGSRMTTREEETACFKVMLSQRDILWVVDGQHRRKAMELVFKFLDDVRMYQKYPKKGCLYLAAVGQDVPPAALQAWHECLEVASGFSTVMVEVHLGLDVDQERQMFHDLNNLAKKVEKSLALKFDTSNPVNRFIKEVLLDDILGWDDLQDKDSTDWHDDNGIWSYKDIVAVNAHLFLNKTNISGATPALVDPKIELATKVWQEVKNIPGFGEPGAKTKTVAAQPVVVKAIAKLAYDFAFGKRRSHLADKHLQTLLYGIGKFNFSHDNAVWQYYQMTEEERIQNNLQGLRDYLPSDDEGYNRDIGRFDPSTGWMRFGAKHNDIYPIVGDMMRWSLGLPRRGQKESTEELLDAL
jgi:hypothetical protein